MPSRETLPGSPIIVYTNQRLCQCSYPFGTNPQCQGESVVICLPLNVPQLDSPAMKSPIPDPLKLLITTLGESKDGVVRLAGRPRRRVAGTCSYSTYHRAPLFTISTGSA